MTAAGSENEILRTSNRREHQRWIVRERTGNVIKNLRAHNTQEWLSAMMTEYGWSQSTVSRLEAGIRDLTLDEAHGLSGIFGVSIFFLSGLPDHKADSGADEFDKMVVELDRVKRKLTNLRLAVLEATDGEYVETGGSNPKAKQPGEVTASERDEHLRSLLTDSDLSVAEIAETVGVHPNTVRNAKKRFGLYVDGRKNRKKVEQ